MVVLSIFVLLCSKLLSRRGCHGRARWLPHTSTAAPFLLPFLRLALSSLRFWTFALPSLRFWTFALSTLPFRTFALPSIPFWTGTSPLLPFTAVAPLPLPFPTLVSPSLSYILPAPAPAPAPICIIIIFTSRFPDAPGRESLLSPSGRPLTPGRAPASSPYRGLRAPSGTLGALSPKRRQTSLAAEVVLHPLKVTSQQRAWPVKGLLQERRWTMW